MPAPTPQVAAPPATPAAPKDLAAQTAALAKEETASAAEDWNPATDPLLSGDAAEADDSADDSDDDDSEDEEAEEPAAEPAAATASDLPADLVELVKSRDLEAIGKRLGIPEADLADFFKVKADDFKAIRHDRQKLAAAKASVADLEQQLRDKYTDPVQARKAFVGGDLAAYFTILEKWSGVPHAEVQKAWALHVQGKPVPKLTPAPTTETAIVVAAPDAEKVAQLKTRITADIAGSKLAAYPGITDLVFNKMKEKWNTGVRTPDAALKLVAEDLKNNAIRDRKTLRAAGVLKAGKGGKAGKKGMGHSPPAARSVTAAAGNPANTRAMTDKELAADVLRSLGKEAWRQ